MSAFHSLSNQSMFFCTKQSNSGSTCSQSHNVSGGKLLLAVLLIGVFFSPRGALGASPSFADVVTDVQPKMVKIYGAGGLQGLEAYQSGFLISATGHVLTTWSYVLDTDNDLVVVILNDGRRFEAKVLGVDPRLEIAVLKFDGKDLPFFNLDQAVDLPSGARVLAFSNLFNVATGNEPASVQHGQITAKTPLAARRGAFETAYRGTVYVMDAMTNNPGAAGGALTDRRGRLAGVLGKELRNSLNNTWLNYAVPIRELQHAVEDILAGRVRPRSTSDEKVKKVKQPLTLALLGIVLVPDVLSKTPPFVDRVVPASVANKAGVRPDDLILFVNGRTTGSRKVLIEELALIDRLDEVRLTVQRGQDLVEFVLRAPDTP